MLKAEKLEELENQYSPSRWSTRLSADVIVDSHLSVTLAATAVARQSLQCELGIEYLAPGGPVLDLYHPPASSETGSLSDAAFVYFHGGYWTALGVEYSGTSAIPLTKHGATVVAVGYTLAPNANMSTIVEQCRKSIVYVRERLKNKRVFISGHSAGAHLAANLMTTDWSQYGMETTPFCGSILISGVYDLTPIQKTYVNDPLQLTVEEVAQFSPLLQEEKVRRLPANFPSLVVWGEEDSPEFKRHSREFSQVLVNHGMVCTNKEISGTDHFELVEKLKDEEYELTQTILKFMSL